MKVAARNNNPDVPTRIEIVQEWVGEQETGKQKPVEWDEEGNEIAWEPIMEPVYEDVEVEVPKYSYRVLHTKYEEWEEEYEQPTYDEEGNETGTETLTRTRRKPVAFDIEIIGNERERLEEVEHRLEAVAALADRANATAQEVAQAARDGSPPGRA